MSPSVSALVASAFIGAVATGIVTLLVRELRETLTIRRRRERFRESLVGEIVAGVNNAGSAEVVTEVGGGMMPTSVFDTDTSKLGLLTEEEIKSITTYYASAQKLDALSSRISANPKEAINPESSGETQLARAYYSERNHVIEKGEEAISNLKTNKSDVGIQAYLLDTRIGRAIKA